MRHIGFFIVAVFVGSFLLGAIPSDGVNALIKGGLSIAAAILFGAMADVSENDYKKRFDKDKQ